MSQDYFVVTPELQSDLERLARLRAEQTLLKAHLQLLEKSVRAAFGECTEARGQDGKVLATWRHSKSVPWFEIDSFKAHHPQLYETYTAQRPGPRRLLLSVGEG